MYKVDNVVQRLALGVSFRNLLDLYAEAERQNEEAVAERLRALIEGRLHEIESWSMGSSIVRENMYGRAGDTLDPLAGHDVMACRDGREGKHHDAHVWYGSRKAGEEPTYHRCLGAGPAVREENAK